MKIQTFLKNDKWCICHFLKKFELGLHPKTHFLIFRLNFKNPLFKKPTSPKHYFKIQ